jgi:hypothetical protein
MLLEWGVYLEISRSPFPSTFLSVHYSYHPTIQSCGPPCYSYCSAPCSCRPTCQSVLLVPATHTDTRSFMFQQHTLTHQILPVPATHTDTPDGRCARRSESRSSCSTDSRLLHLRLPPRSRWNAALLRHYAANMVISYRRFGTTCRSHIQESRINPRPLKMGPRGCPETSVRNYRYSVRNDAEECSSPLYFGLPLLPFLPCPSACFSSQCAVTPVTADVSSPT